MRECEIVIRNERGEFPRIVDAVDRFAAEHRVPTDVLVDMQIALDEILSNIVSYGYEDGMQHAIRVRIRLIENALEATVEDDGVAFNPLESHMPDLSVPLSERPIGRIGLHFVKNLMHEIAYDRVGDRNRLVLKRHLRT